MRVDIVTFRNWVRNGKIKVDGGRELRIAHNPAFFFKGFVGRRPEDETRFRKLKEALENRLHPLDWAITFTFKCDEEAGTRPKWSVSVRGEILSQLQHILYYDNWERNLKLVAKEVGVHQEEIELPGVFSGVISRMIERKEAREMKPDPYSGFKRHFVYFQKEIDVPDNLLDEALNGNVEWDLSLQLVIEEDVKDIHDRMTNRTSGLNGSWIIEWFTKDVSECSLDQAVLSAHSKVFAAKNKRAGNTVMELKVHVSPVGVQVQVNGSGAIWKAVEFFEVADELKKFARLFQIFNLRCRN